MYEMELTIPLAQMVLFVIMISLCLLLARYRLGLAITFCFTFYWGFIYNKDIFFSSLEASSLFLAFYCICGFLLIVFALYSFGGED
jgi:hypothetical protein